MKPLAVVCALLMSTTATAQISYPSTEKGPVVESAFGQKLPDPYRWLEDDARNNPKVAAWVAAQNKVTQDYLATLPGRDAIKARLTELWNYERLGIPKRAGGRYFYTRNDGLQNQSALYVRDGLNGTPRLLIDPNTWAKDGATALDSWKVAEDGAHLAYQIQDGGSDWRTVRFLDVADATVLPDELKWVKFSEIAWARDGSGVFYSRFPEPAGGQTFQALNERQAVYFHKLGTPQSADRLVYATPDRPKLNNSAEVTDDGAWLVITSSEGTDERLEITLIDLRQPGAKPVTLIKGLEHNWKLAGGEGDTLFFITNKGAPLQRIVRIDAANPGAAPVEVIGEDKSMLDNAHLVGGKLLALYLVDAKSEVRRFAPDGKAEGKVTLPGIGTADGFEGDPDNPETFFSFGSFNQPGAIYRYDAATNAVSVFAQPKVAFDPAAFEVTQTFYPSKDGTKIPLFLVRKKGVTGPRPTILYGYGGFNISLTPDFSPAILDWVDMGGVYAMANLRGGGEYGKGWHDAGRLANKQNVFDDFAAAAEHLKGQGIASKIAISGRSNGGLLVGATTNQRPDLFAAALPAVGVMDMLRFDRFTAGRYWVDDYGYPERAADWAVLRKYSPYHNIRSGADYPAILVSTADTDDRVVPGHSFKYTAALQAADIGDKPHLIRIETRAGHGAGKPTSKKIEEAADLWAFAAKWTDLAVPAPTPPSRP
ncbi:prolyl oligopeptidase family serine peptidase [Sphingomonas sp. ID0503]|uniref:prolyl oligopeptidase family serine peptidase n=1 Tax=Sphingomonas sp. ID0503 TaxID=3399691 RepID=UPI003AFACAD1